MEDETMERDMRVHVHDWQGEVSRGGHTCSYYRVQHRCKARDTMLSAPVMAQLADGIDKLRIVEYIGLGPGHCTDK